MYVLFYVSEKTLEGNINSDYLTSGGQELGLCDSYLFCWFLFSKFFTLLNMCYFYILRNRTLKRDRSFKEELGMIHFHSCF